MNYSEYAVAVSIEPSYYGSSCTPEDAERIADNLSSLIQWEFPGIRIERFVDGRGSSKTTGPNEDETQRINLWIEENWTKAL